MVAFRTVKAKIKPDNPQALFLPYQDRWIKDGSTRKIMQKSRQIGMSWSTSYGLVRRKSLKDCQFDAWVSSRDEIQARLFLEDCKAFADLVNVAADDLGQQILDPDSKSTAFVLQLVKRINSMSSNPDAQAGKRGDRVLDEFALHKDNRKLYAIAYPGITWGGMIEIISTHRGNANFFNELVLDVTERENPKKFSLHTVTLQDALDQGFLWKLQQKLPLDREEHDMDEAEYFTHVRSGCDSEESFQQEYMCRPADDSEAFLTWEMISKAELTLEADKKREWEIPLSDCAGDLYMGVDIGRHHDLTVVYILEKYQGVYFTRRMIEMEKTSFSDQKSVIWPLLENPKIRKACFDNTGLGMQMAEEAKKKFKYRVEEVTFGSTVKEALAYPVRSAFEDGQIKIPYSNKLRNDLRGVKKEVTAAGNIRFSADTGPNGHSDRFWALALALHGANNRTFVPLPRRFNTVNRVADALARRRNRSLAG